MALPIPHRSRFVGVAFAAACLIVVLAGCRRLGTEATEPEIVGGPGGGLAIARSAVELGVYSGDMRVAGLAERWSDTVERGVERLGLVSGLAFPATRSPRVVLAPLGDEDREYVVGSEVFEGRRLAVLRVNLEPLAAGRRDVDRVLLRGLATAVFEDAAHRKAPVPPWVVEAAAIVAGGDLDARLIRLRRRQVTDDVPATVDPTSARAVSATAAAAILVLLDSGRPDALRRFLAFAAEGDDPDEMLARRLRDPVGAWAGVGRQLLDARLAAIDPEPWQLLAKARKALADTGRGGMESVLPSALPPGTRAEITLLRAQALADEGDYDGARLVLASLGERAYGDLRDAGGATALRIRAERAVGDASEAQRLEDEWRRDYPRLAAYLGADAAQPVGTVRRTVATLDATVRRVQELLASHDAGAARRVLEALGEAGLAPELTDVHLAVANAESSPSPQAIEVGRRRARAWLVEPNEAAAQAVRDGGAAAAIAMAENLPAAPGTSRSAAVRLLVESGETGRAVELLTPTWRRDRRLVVGDLDALLAVSTFAELRVWVQGAGGIEVSEDDWRRVRYGLDIAWVVTHPGVFRDLRSAAYPVRKGAFDLVLASGETTPDLVARGLADPAPLLRRTAVRAAGERGFRALVEVAFADEAWVVRQTACAAAARALGNDASRLLVDRFQRDDSSQVRLAAAKALLDLGAPGPDALRVLVTGIADEDPQVRDFIAAGLPGLPTGRLLPALMDALDAEAARRAPRGPILARQFLVLRRAVRQDPGYDPGMSPAEVRTLLARIRASLARGR